MNRDEISKVLLRIDTPIGGTIGRLAAEYPKGFTVKDIIHAIYPDGGEPPDVAQYFSRAVRRVKNKIEPHGWTIPKARGSKKSLGIYRLEKLL